MKEIYQPAEDSYFFSDFLKEYLINLKNRNIFYLDMGCGSGILSEIAEKFINKKNIFAADINPKSVKLTKQKDFNAIKTDLFKKIKLKFDLITFNAPYLQEDLREPINFRIATTGGKKGDEISVRFLNEAKKHLNKKGKIFLLISSITPMNKIKRFKPKIVARKKLFFEELFIIEIS